MAVVPKIPAVSVEYVHVPVTSDVQLDTQAVQIVFLGATASPTDATTWNDAEWEGSAGTTRSARILIGTGSDVGELAAGTWSVWVKVTDTPEVPVRSAGTIQTV
jgi:hypothetical protein